MPNDDPRNSIAAILPGFVEYMRVERQFSAATIAKYQDSIGCFLRDVGNPRAAELSLQHFISLKSKMMYRNVQASRITSVICAVKNLLAYARDVLKVPVMDLTTVKLLKKAKRTVVYLSNEELDQFINAIPLRTWEGKFRIAGYRFRALVEVLVTTGMRISEALSLNRDDVDFERGEAKIVGKGNKERIVFFSSQARDWLRRYLDLRCDSRPALFVTSSGSRLNANMVEATFRRNSRWAGLTKRVTPHIIRHTMATNLLRNGCPIGYIKELLGHEKLETTCRFYLGILESADVKNAHRTYQDFSPDRDRTARNAMDSLRSSTDQPIGTAAGEVDKYRTANTLRV
jgi:integrase/recombinase XerD